MMITSRAARAKVAYIASVWQKRWKRQASFWLWPDFAGELSGQSGSDSIWASSEFSVGELRAVWQDDVGHRKTTCIIDITNAHSGTVLLCIPLCSDVLLTFLVCCDCTSLWCSECSWRSWFVSATLIQAKVICPFAIWKKSSGRHIRDPMSWDKWGANLFW